MHDALRPAFTAGSPAQPSSRGPHTVLHLVPALLLAAVVAMGCGSSQKTTDAEPGVDVGYGTQSEDGISGAVSTVDVDEAMKDRPVTNVAELLRGRVSGVYVQDAPGGFRVRIRGATSFQGSTEPLYVVDGMAIQPDPDGTITTINPHDIAEISVLKDAAATAIYGSRGANGVIVIKTKKM